ncbi:MAG: NfeD family protein [Cyanobacteria bacterium SIG30]|nr:NfeD family protein [Cyanobacteria bacterium SIG30]
MQIYLIWAISGFILLFLELAIPSLFFLNLAAGAFFASCIAYFFPNLYWAQISIFTIISIFCILALRPYMLRQYKSNTEESSYVGRDAKVTDEIKEEDGGKIKIYDEIWPAKSVDNSFIAKDETVKIIKQENMIMFVKKV